MSALRSVAAWTSPALLVGLATRVLAGDGAVPFVLLAAVVAPLVALLRGEAGSPRDPVAAAAGWLATATVVWASLRTLGDAGTLAGLPPTAGILAGGVVALLVAIPGVPDRPWLVAGAAAPLVLAAVLAAVAAALAAWPWQAWATLASRPALVFAPGSEWVTTGGVVAATTTFSVVEPHRIVVLTPGVYRVVERDAGLVAVREWRLAAGASLSLRSGDELTAPAGTRLRFEAGKRVPGSARSGPAWAARANGGAPGAAEAAGLALTFVGGALALVAPARRAGAAGAAAGPGVVLVATLTMTAWGVYATAAAPDLLLGEPTGAAILRLPLVAVERGGVGLLGLTLGAVAALFAGMAAAGRDRATTLSALGAGRGAVAWSALVVGAGLATAAPVDTWQGLILGLGLTACGTLGPGLYAARRPRLAGALVAGAAFGGLVLAAPWGAPGGSPVASAPALVAVPLGLAAAWVAGRQRR